MPRILPAMDPKHHASVKLAATIAAGVLITLTTLHPILSQRRYERKLSAWLAKDYGIRVNPRTAGRLENGEDVAILIDGVPEIATVIVDEDDMLQVVIRPGTLLGVKNAV